MEYYKTKRIIDKKPPLRTVIVDDNGKVINKNPTKEELKDLKTEPRKYRDTTKKPIYRNSTNACDICGIRFELAIGHPYREYDKEGKETGKWTCLSCYDTKRKYGVYKKPVKNYNLTNTCDNIKEDSKKCEEKLIVGKAIREKDENGVNTGKWLCNKCYAHIYDKTPGCGHAILKELANCRTRNLDPNSSRAKGDRTQKLTCTVYGWIDLNEENDNYRSPIDCYDPNTGTYHQVQGRFFDYIYGFWQFDFREEYSKEFVDMICLCYNEDGKIVERIYIIPKSEIIIRASVSIVKYRRKKGLGWYEQYRVTNEEVEKVNDIWKQINL